MATLYLLCGLPGSGKTTLARKLERESPALRLCPDEWMAPLFGSDLPQGDLDAHRTPVETVQWDIAAAALRLGVNVVMENGFWAKAEREDFRRRADGLGARVELRYLEVPREVLWERLSRRNADLPPDTFQVTKAQFDEWWGAFEPPDSEELRK
ncbi:MAG: AAA family ATPase [Gemmatimonadota bacterium]|nr:AAA family ATPase [Gemmatimonadota bacterium]